MAEVVDSFHELLPFEVFYESESESEEFDFHDEGETIITSPFCPNSSFHGEDEEGTLTPVFSPDHYPFPSTGSDHVSLETLDHLDLGLGLSQEPSPAAPHTDSGLRVAGFGSGSESDPDAEPDPIPNPGELCWDDDDFFEWEEVEDRPISGTAEWELLTGTPMAPLMEELDDDDDDEGESLQDFDMNPSGYEILFGHFAPIWVGGLPASKAAMESIQSVSVEAGEDACAVCKEEMEGTVRQMPCSHRYHRDCILPWLAIRNTCPACRFELPTDCPCYESGRRGTRYDSEMFPQM